MVIFIYPRILILAALASSLLASAIIAFASTLLFTLSVNYIFNGFFNFLLFAAFGMFAITLGLGSLRALLLLLFTLVVLFRRVFLGSALFLRLVVLLH